MERKQRNRIRVRNLRFSTWIRVLILTFILFGCGGGGDDDNSGQDPNDNIPAGTSPTASAFISPADEVEEGASVTLDGSGSSDGDGTISSYVWSQVSPESPAIDFSGDDTADATFSFNAPAVATQTVFTFELQVTDNSGETGSAQVQLTVNAFSGMAIFQQIRSNVTDLTAAAPSVDDDWMHWGGEPGSEPTVTRKSGGTALDDYSLIGDMPPGGIKPIAVAHKHTFKWSDGDPTPDSSSLSSTFNHGIYFAYTGAVDSQIGHGFAITVPADDTPRALTLIVGVLDAEMKIAANFNNSADPATPILTSSEEFIDNPTSANLTDNTKNKGMYRAVTIIYRATTSQADQMTVQCTLNDDYDTPSALFLDSAVLSQGAVTAPVITPAGGQFSGPVSVENMTAYPTDAQIRYTTDGSAPTEDSPLFSPFTLTADTTVNAQAFRSGYAVSPVTTADFKFTTVSSGALGITVQDAPLDAVNLTVAATDAGDDWTQYGKDSFDDINRKVDVNLIGAVSEVDSGAITNGPIRIGNPIPYAFDWTDGSPTDPSEQEALNIRRGVFFFSFAGDIGGGYAFNVPADTTSRTLLLHMGVQDADAKISAVLSSDPGNPVEVTVMNDPAGSNGTWLLFKVVKIDFTGGNDSDTLTVTTTMEGDYDTASAVSIQAAILSRN